MNRLIFCHKAFSKAGMMQGSVEIQAFSFLTEGCDARVIFGAIFTQKHKYTHSLIHSTGKN